MSYRVPKLIFGLVCFGLIGARWAAAELSETNGMQLKDLSKRVEVVVDGRLRAYSPGFAEVGVSLWNPTERDMLGPIFLIVDGSGINGVTVANQVEQTKDGKGIFEIVPEGKALLGHGMTDVVSMIFETPKAFSLEQAKEFSLSTRVLGREGSSSGAFAPDREDDATFGKSYNQAELDRVKAIQDKYTPELLKRQGVVGTAIVEDSKGQLNIRIYSETRALAKALPGNLDNVKVDVHPQPGGFKADPARDSVIYTDGKWESHASREKKRKTAPPANKESAGVSAAPGGDPTIRFDRPVPIGVSAFNATETICATGTLGCRCIDSSGKIYGLSNSHVLSKEGASALLEEIVQPGQADNNCNTDIANNLIGRLYDFVPSFIDPLDPRNVNFMDTGLFEVVDALDPDGNTVPAVSAETPEDGYGFPSKRIIRNPRILQTVQKYGRTTVYTRGIVTGLNVTANVGGGAGFKPYQDLIEIISTAPYAAFSQGGDSGSLIVTQDGNRPIALLFAGGPNLLGIDETLGNPIGPILDRYNVSVDDGQNPDVRTGADGTEGISGREGIGLANLGQDDKFFRLPPELWGRVKNPKHGIVPIPDPLGPQNPAP